MTPSNRRGARPAAALAAAVLCAALAAGCGIRTTSVPVDAGPAPSRVPCAMPAEDISAQAQQGIPVQVYLVCAGELVAVDRTVRVQESTSDRLRIARALLDEVRREPPETERLAGFSTRVPAALRVSGPGRGDAPDTLRLSEQPEDLVPEALAQLVCTFADSDALSPENTVTLGGPGTYPPRGYLCTAETKASPEAVPTLDSTPRP